MKFLKIRITFFYLLFFSVKLIYFIVGFIFKYSNNLTMIYDHVLLFFLSC